MSSAMTRIHGPLQVAVRLVVLAATLAALVATSAPVCGKHTPPVVFRATGTCGPNGLVVASVDSASQRISFANVAVLGLPPDVQGQADGYSCPITVEHGDWQVHVPTCTGDGGATTTGCGRTCTVEEVASGPLQFVCVDAKGLPLCTSTLTVEE